MTGSPSGYRHMQSVIDVTTCLELPTEAKVSEGYRPQRDGGSQTFELGCVGRKSWSAVDQNGIGRLVSGLAEEPAKRRVLLNSVTNQQLTKKKKSERTRGRHLMLDLLIFNSCGIVGEGGVMQPDIVSSGSRAISWTSRREGHGLRQSLSDEAPLNLRQRACHKLPEPRVYWLRPGGRRWPLVAVENSGGSEPSGAQARPLRGVRWITTAIILTRRGCGLRACFWGPPTLVSALLDFFQRLGTRASAGPHRADGRSGAFHSS